MKIAIAYPPLISEKGAPLLSQNRQFQWFNRPTYIYPVVPKWKDYVDLYFLLTGYFSIEAISKKAMEIFGPLFSEKQFRAQLAYFDDIDYSETVDFLIDQAPSADEIKEKLTAISLSGV